MKRRYFKISFYFKISYHTRFIKKYRQHHKSKLRHNKYFRTYNTAKFSISILRKKKEEIFISNKIFMNEKEVNKCKVYNNMEERIFYYIRLQHI